MVLVMLKYPALKTGGQNEDLGHKHSHKVIPAGAGANFVGLG